MEQNQDNQTPVVYWEEVQNGTSVPDFRKVTFYPATGETYNSGYRSGGTWVDGWWS